MKAKNIARAGVVLSPSLGLASLGAGASLSVSRSPTLKSLVPAVHQASA